MKKFSIVMACILIVLLSGYLWRRGVRNHDASDVLVVGTNAEYPPFSFIENDRIVGFDIDIVQEIVRRLGKSIRIQDMPFDLLLPKLQLGDIHLVAAGMTMTPERALRVNFTKPYLAHDPLLIITLASRMPLEQIKDLEGKIVVVNEGYTADVYLSQFNQIMLRRLASPTEAFLALQSGRADAFVAAQSSVQAFFAHHGKDNFRIDPLEAVHDDYALVVSKKYPMLLAQIEEVLGEMQDDGTLQRLKKTWNIND